jgi:hypothetical protein
MVRWLSKILGLCVFIIGGSIGVWFIQDRYSTQHQIAKLEEEKRVLTEVVQRLTDEKRVAQVLVTDQTTFAGGSRTTLLFVEDAKDGTSLPPRTFTIDGNEAHIDALVIRFKQDFVTQGDPLRGHSIALFTRIYGASQTPGQGFAIDEPGKIPEIYRGADPRVTEFEMDLWKNFWRLADDPEYREKKGVEIANGQGVWGPFEPDKLYTITIQSHGGVSITSQPLKGIYRAALKRPTTAAAQ